MKPEEIDTIVEEWKDIPGYEGVYQISSFGRVKSIRRYVKRGESLMFVPEKILKNVVARNGYYVVNLNNHGYKTMYIHRLLAEAFLENPNPDKYNCVEHINADRLDNKIQNLRWCSYVENNNNPITRQRMSAGSIGINPSEKTIAALKEAASKPVKQLSVDGVVLKVWPSVTDASRALQICGQTIYRCCNHPLRGKTAGGYKWSY